MRFRGSQKSTSCSDATDRAYGGGDGDNEGHDSVDRKSPEMLELREGVFPGCDCR